ncbi:MAG TPA: hypothetical protein PLO29_08750, partial [Paludibacter sp.]|nr:hypothetical protein [Paludibacter sp.]
MYVNEHQASKKTKINKFNLFDIIRNFASSLSKAIFKIFLILLFMTTNVLFSNLPYRVADISLADYGRKE